MAWLPSAPGVFPNNVFWRSSFLEQILTGKLSEFITLASLYFIALWVLLLWDQFISSSRAEFFLGKHRWSLASVIPVGRVGAVQ